MKSKRAVLLVFTLAALTVSPFQNCANNSATSGPSAEFIAASQNKSVQTFLQVSQNNVSALVARASYSPQQIQQVLNSLRQILAEVQALDASQLSPFTLGFQKQVIQQLNVDIGQLQAALQNAQNGSSLASSSSSSSSLGGDSAASTASQPCVIHKSCGDVPVPDGAIVSAGCTVACIARLCQNGMFSNTYPSTGGGTAITFQTQYDMTCSGAWSCDMNMCM